MSQVVLVGLNEDDLYLLSAVLYVPGDSESEVECCNFDM